MKEQEDYYEYFYQHYLIDCQYFIYNGVESDNGGCGYLYNNGYDNINEDTGMTLKDVFNFWDKNKTKDYLEEVKKLMDNKDNKIIYVSDIDGKIIIRPSNKDEFINHMSGYGDEVIVDSYGFARDSDMFLSKLNID